MAPATSIASLALVSRATRGGAGWLALPRDRPSVPRCRGDVLGVTDGRGVVARMGSRGGVGLARAVIPAVRGGHRAEALRRARLASFEASRREAGHPRCLLWLRTAADGAGADTTAGIVGVVVGCDGRPRG